MHFEQYNCILEQLLFSPEPLKFDVSKKEQLYLKISTERSKEFRILLSLPMPRDFFSFSFCCLSKLLTLRIGRKMSPKIELIIKGS